MSKNHDDNCSMIQTKGKIDEVFDHVTEYSDSQKEHFESTLNEMVKPIEKQIESLKARSESMTDEGKRKMERLALKLETQRDMFVARIKAMNAATGQAWLQLKDGLYSAWSDLSESIETAATTSQSTFSNQS